MSEDPDESVPSSEVVAEWARWLERERERQPHLGDKFAATARALRALDAEVRRLEDRLDDIAMDALERDTLT